MPAIEGFCDPGYQPVGEAFLRCFAEFGETGGATCVYLAGKPVVDLWGGTAAAGREWGSDTLVHVYSVTKPFAAASLLRLIETGDVVLDAPVARYWPEFAAAGKGAATIRQLLSHQAGLLTLDESQPAGALLDWDGMCALLAAESPLWPPGSAAGEHALFYGHLVGEVVRRVSGISLGQFFGREIARPWGLEFFIGLEPAEEGRCAMVEGIDATWQAAAGGEPGSLRRRALNNPPGALDSEVVNSAAWRRAEIPAINGHATARAIARFYAGMAYGGELDGVRLFSERLIAEALTAQFAGIDRLLDRPLRWGLGFQLDDDGFGMGGLGGALGWGNAARAFGFGYVTRRMADHARAMAVYEAAARCAGFMAVTG